MQFLEALTRGDFNIDIMRMGYKLDDFPYAQAGPNIKCTNFAVTAHLKPASTRQPGNRATEICALVGSSAVGNDYSCCFQCVMKMMIFSQLSLRASVLVMAPVTLKHPLPRIAVCGFR